MTISNPEHEDFESAVDPNKKVKTKQNMRWFLITGIATIIVAFVLWAVVLKPSPSADPTQKQQPNKELQKEVKTTAAAANFQPLSPEAKAAQLQGENTDIRTTNDQLQNQILALQSENDSLKNQQTQMEQRFAPTPQRGPSGSYYAARQEPPSPDAVQVTPPTRLAASNDNGGQMPAEVSKPKRRLSVIGGSSGSSQLVADASGGNAANPPAAQVKTSGKSSGITDNAEIYDSREFVPPNSYASAVMLVGADITTGVGGQSDPKPVLLRIDSDAIGVGFAERFQRTSLKGCLVNGAAYGDLPSEKVFIKLVKITCPYDENRFATTNVEGFVTHLGKTGIRGPVITRDGVLTRQAMIAGLFQGLGQAMSVNNQRNLTTVTGASGTSVMTQGLSNDQIMGATVGGGIQNAAQTLSEYLIKRAEQYQPVIEMKTGVRVEIVFQNGFRVPTAKKR